jgi:hypothetical protein
MKKMIVLTILISQTLGPLAHAQPVENLPKLYDTVPEQLFRTLGTVGAGAKTILEAREQLQREARKVSADAVVAVSCEEGGITRDGLNFAKELPYCRGMAVKWAEEAKPL